MAQERQSGVITKSIERCPDEQDQRNSEGSNDHQKIDLHREADQSQDGGHEARLYEQLRMPAYSAPQRLPHRKRWGRRCSSV